MPVNRVSHGKTIELVAKNMAKMGIGSSKSPWKMDTEDRVIRVYGVGEEGVMAFTDLGPENLADFIKVHKADPSLLNRSDDAK